MNFQETKIAELRARVELMLSYLGKVTHFRAFACEVSRATHSLEECEGTIFQLDWIANGKFHGWQIPVRDEELALYRHEIAPLARRVVGDFVRLIVQSRNESHDQVFPLVRLLETLS